MKLDEGRITVAAAAFAIIGIALLFFMSETAQAASVAQALVAEPNTLLIVRGTAANVTAEKFSLCDQVCISVRNGSLPSAALLSSGRGAVVEGRVKEYLGRRYIEAGKIEVG